MNANKLKHFVFCLLILINWSSFGQVIRLSENWQFFYSENKKWYPASVPGCIHTDLQNAGLIKNPFYDCNEQNLQWIENQNWEYKCSFELPQDFIIKNKNIELVFEGLDTYASIFLNDNKILVADNMFCEWRVDCRKHLKKGKNVLSILFESPVVKAKQQASLLRYTLPGDEKVFVRKAQYQFGWDWGPRFVTSGIWKKVYLTGWNKIILDDVQVVQNKLSENKAEMEFICSIRSADNLKFYAKLKNIAGSETSEVMEINLSKGSNEIKIPMEVLNPRLWWTHNLGEPYLYNFRLFLFDDSDTLAFKDIKFGIRKLELINEPDKFGSSFYFKLNNVPVFMKGANYIPQESFLNRLETLDYKKLIGKAKESNCNMLRVWGGGIYENDIFYDLCDENGILVWQDFMFACAMYPGDSCFLNSVRTEAEQNIKRLRNHPCIALWCGNNEIEEGWNNWGWQKQYKYSVSDSTEIWGNYLKLFREVLPRAVSQYDSQRFYWPSSPMYGWGRKQSLTDGDCHYWGVWWGLEPFETYKHKVGRFMSEYGFQGFPDYYTLAENINSDELFLGSKSFKCHQKHPTGFETIKTYMEREFISPENPEDYIYVSQLLQAYGMKTAIEAHRTAKPYCMGTLYWQLNDCWPVVSWSSIDYYSRPKAFYYFSKKAYSDVLLTIKNEEKIEIYVVSDKLEDTRALLKLKLLGFGGKLYWFQNKFITIKGNSSKSYDDILKMVVLNGSIPLNRTVLLAELISNDECIASNTLYFCKTKELELDKPDLTYTFEKNGDIVKIIFKSDKLVKNLFISFKPDDDKDIYISDNYFDLLPGRPEFVVVKSTKSIEYLRENIKIKTLYDINK